MNDTHAVIRRIRRINSRYQQLDLTVGAAALKALKPGQTLLARLLDADESEGQVSWDPYLREQWWPLGYTSENVLVVERPFSHRYQPNQTVQLLGPIGKPFRFRQNIRNILLLAHNTDPSPLTAMIGQVLHHGVSVTLVLLGAATAYQTDHLPAEVEVIKSGDALEWPDMVMTLGWADQIFTAVAADDELGHFRAIMQLVSEKRASVPPQYIFGVFQPMQPCGVGACGACMLRVKKDIVPVCTQGPAFDLTQVSLPR